MIYAFEGIDVSLKFMPLAARRALDRAGRKVSLEGWTRMTLADRQALVTAGAADSVDLGCLLTILAKAAPAAVQQEPVADPDPDAPSPALLAALGTSRPLDAARWRTLRPLDRYALVKSAGKPEKLARAYDAIVPRLTHLTDTGDARMVDVGAKERTARRAVATARVRTSGDVVRRIARGDVPKGDVLATARIAGIMAAKRTSELIPLCHPIALTRVEVALELDEQAGEIRVRATAETVDRTGVEMEAMVAATVSTLTIYDMLKSVDRWLTIDAVRLEEKSGGKSGHVVRP